MEDYKIQEKLYQRRIARRLEYDLVAMLPDLERRNDISKAQKVRSNYQFPIESQKPYQWEHPGVDMPGQPNDEWTGVKEMIQEHIEHEVSEELGDVYQLIQTMTREMRSDRLRRESQYREWQRTR